MTDRRELGQQLRVDSIRTSAAAGSGHPTSSMSANSFLKESANFCTPSFSSVATTSS